MKPPIRKDSAMKRPHPFTLVELLVVIAVIAILAALLFPTIKSVKEAAKKTQCLDNQKNIHTYVHQFATNNNQSLKGVLSDWKYWYRNMIDANDGFLNGDKPDSGYLKPDSNGQYKYLNAAGVAMMKVFRCPSDASLHFDAQGNPVKFGSGALASYGRNDPTSGGTMKYKTGSNGARGDALRDPRLVDSRLNDIGMPSDLILVTDHWGPTHRPGESENSEEYESNNVYHLRPRENDANIGELGTKRDNVSRHKGSPPIAFMDGHVTMTDWKKTIPPRFYDDTKEYGKGLGWQGRAVGSWSDSIIVKK